MSLNEPTLPFEIEESSICFRCEENKYERKVRKQPTTHKGRRLISASGFVRKAGKWG